MFASDTLETQMCGFSRHCGKTAHMHTLAPVVGLL